MIRYKKLYVFIIICIAGFTTLYSISMLARGLDFRKDNFFSESMGNIPFKYNYSKDWAVTQSIAIKNSEAIHSVYLFEFYGFFYRKELVFKFIEDDSLGSYSSEQANSWLNWHGNDELNISIKSAKKIYVKEDKFNTIKINYPFL